MAARMCSFVFAWLGAAAAATGQTAAPLREVIDTSLERRLGSLVAITPEEVRLRDPDGRAFSVSRARALALLPPAASEEPPRPRPVRQAGDDTAWVYLTDGQALPGRPTHSAGEDVEWDSRLFSRIRLRLDEVAMLVLRTPAAPSPASPDGPADTVSLVNGDAISGYVESIDSTLVVEHDGRKSQVPLDRVAWIRLANPPREPAGIVLWTWHGSVVSLTSIDLPPEGAARLVGTLATPAGPAHATIPSADIRAVLFDAARLRPLASLSVASMSGGPGRRWTPPLRVGDAGAAPMGAPDIEIPGPATAEWTLPPGAARFAAVAELPLECRVWGDCEIALTLVAGTTERQLVRERLWSDRASLNINAQLDESAGGGRLRIEVLPGRAGPIQDSVRLRRPLVLIGR